MGEITKKEIQQEITTQSKFNTLAKVQSSFVDGLLQDLSMRNFKFTPNQQLCGYNTLQAIDMALRKEGLSFNSDKVEQESIKTAIQVAIVLQLNPNAIPSELFVEVRNANIDGKWTKTVRVAPQGAGNIKILRKYGSDVVAIGNIWIVRDGDEFSYPKFKGFEIEPPQWNPKSYTGKVLRVVVPIRKKDGVVEFAIAERESVATNLKAQIKNSLMKSEKQQAVMEYIKDKPLDEMLDDEKLAKVISPSYRDYISREEMITTKLINNAIKRIPKDFDNAFVSESYQKTFDTEGLYDGKVEEAPLTVKELADEITVEQEITAKPIPKDEKPTANNDQENNTQPRKPAIEFGAWKDKVSDTKKPDIMEKENDDLPF